MKFLICISSFRFNTPPSLSSSSTIYIPPFITSLIAAFHSIPLLFHLNSIYTLLLTSFYSNSLISPLTPSIYLLPFYASFITCTSLPLSLYASFISPIPPPLPFSSTLYLPYLLLVYLPLVLPPSSIITSLISCTTAFYLNFSTILHRFISFPSSTFYFLFVSTTQRLVSHATKTSSASTPPR